MCHFVGIVVEADYRFALLNSRKQHHQSSVCHHQIQVVLCEVKIYSLHCGKKDTLLYICHFIQRHILLIAIISTHNVKENLTDVNSVQQFTDMVLEGQKITNMLLFKKTINLSFTNTKKKKDTIMYYFIVCFILNHIMKSDIRVITVN